MSKFLPEQHEALRRIIKDRTCPPLDLLAKGGPEVEAHMRVCDECRESLEYIDIYKDFSAHAATLTSLKKQPSPLQAGQVRGLLRKAVETIQDGHTWYAPPLVLVIHTKTGVSGMALVAQIHDAPELEGPGDVPLGAQYEDGFAESWNTYPAFEDCLTPALSVVPPDVVEKVRHFAEQGLPEVEENSPMEAFRVQEIETGAWFGHPALGRALALQKAAQEQEQARPAAPAQSVLEKARQWLEGALGQALPGLDAVPAMAMAAAPATATAGEDCLRAEALLGGCSAGGQTVLRRFLVQWDVERLKKHVMLTGTCMWPDDLRPMPIKGQLLVTSGDMLATLSVDTEWVENSLRLYTTMPLEQWDREGLPQLILIMDA